MIERSNIKIISKIRPDTKGKSIINYNEQKKQIYVRLPSQQTQRIQVDMIYDANKTEQSIYSKCKINNLVDKFIQGCNISIITYGQSGSGKTFSLQGDSNHKGIIFESLQNIYNKTSNEVIIKCSFIQLYNEKISDMLNPECGGERGLKLRWQIQKEFIIEDHVERQCKTYDEIMKQWNAGNKNRIIANNKINDYSSRSHSIFIVTMEDHDEQKNARIRKAYFVDLAGSQKVFTPVGRLTKEAIEINKSLFFLRKVIISLQQRNNTNKEVYIPYRDSKLTSILKKSFGGNCLTYMIACLNPSEDYLEQTLSTLQYAISAGKIHNEITLNIDQKSKQIHQLKSQNQKLKQQLQYALLQIQSLKSIQRQQQVKRSVNSQYANKIVQCIGTVRQLLKSNKQLRRQLQKEKLEKRQICLELEECQKNVKMLKKKVFEKKSPIAQYQDNQHNHKNKINMNITKTKINTINNSIIEEESSLTQRPLISQSVDFLKRKHRPKTIIHRKKYCLHQKSLS